MRHFSYHCVLLVLFLLPNSLFAQVVESVRPLSDSIPARPVVDSTITVSLLTCSPGQETYELYGHTAIRVTDSQNPTGIVYNYGAFDFNAPNFTWRFILGECDYLLWAEPLEIFAIQYVARGSWVREQVLNLTPEEATMLRDSLRNESRPENRVYRYNIFRNNCTTRARDIIERCVDGRIIYPMRTRRNTFRSILYQYTEEHPWAREGNDLLLGTNVDTLINERDEMFAPLYLMQYVDSAMIDAGRTHYRNLVRESRILIQPDDTRQQAAADAQPDFPLSPKTLGWLVFALGVCLAAYEVWRRHICWGIDAVLMTVQGLAGILLCFMALFSVHPAVASNWQVWVLNPIPLFFVYSVVQSDRRSHRNVYHTLFHYSTKV